MKFYKIIKEDNFIGIGTSFDLRRFQLKHKIILICDEAKCQYIQNNDELYHALWMHPINNSVTSYSLADVIEINEDEYISLKKLIDVDDETLRQPKQNTIDINTLSKNQITVDYIKKIKIKEMSDECNKLIVSGFDIVLEDGMSHHFDLTIEDQINLIEASDQIKNGDDKIIYHASNEKCKFYTIADMKSIIDFATKLKKYHTTYFNSLKQYICSLDNIEAISNVSYGIDIPAEYVFETLNTFKI